MNKASVGYQKSHMYMGILVLALVIFVLTFPMSLNWVWDEGSWGHHGQYEKMTEAILDGHLYMDYDVDPKLLELENPYDRGAREAAGVSYEFDHAFYDGHYYMYFGVVPVFILFLPLKLLGITLASSQGTQVFAALTVVGVFALFDELKRRFGSKISFSSYLALSCAASFVSLWYAVKYPALYCTAITSGVCLAVWGIYFAVKALDTSVRKTIVYATLAALFGALVFGCRPTIGFVSLVYIPMIWHFVRTRFSEWDKADKWKVAIGFCLPYVIVAILLMTYNYVRFDNPFEFGQSYQLTLVDQHQYMGNSLLFGAGFWQRLADDISFYFVAKTPLGERFPYIHEDGMITLFPMVLLGVAAFVRGKKREVVASKNGKQKTALARGLAQDVGDKSSLLQIIAIAIIVTVFVIIFVQTKWSPNVLRRYAMDFAFLLMILMFLGVCRIFASVKGKYIKLFNGLMIVMSVLTCLVCVLLFFTTGESAMADVHPELIDKIEEVLHFWR